MQAQLTRELQERHGNQFGFILLMAGKAAKKCRCGKLECPACGFMRFHLRVRKIEQNRNLTTGYLSGGKTNPSML